MSFTLKGPLFDFDARAKAEQIIEEAQDETATEGAELIRYRLGTVLKNPTGYYQSQVQADLSYREKSITDNGVVYGPWLEGIGSRNSTTRFKGYATFRNTTNAIQDLANSRAERAANDIARAWS